MFSLLPKTCFCSVFSYAIETQWKLHPKIDANLLINENVNQNPRAIDFLLDHPQRILPMIAQHPHTRLVAYLLTLSKPIEPSFRRWLTKNPHPVIVEYLLSHPDEIDNNTLCENTNDRMVEFFIQTFPTRFTGNRQGLFRNPNNKMIDFVLSFDQSKIDIDGFRYNANPRSAHYLIHNQLYPDQLYSEHGWSIKDPPIHEEWVDHYIEWTERTPYRNYQLSYHPDPKAVGYLLSHPDKIHSCTFSQNPNEEAVTYLLAHPELMTLRGKTVDKMTVWIPPYLSSNTNPRIIQFLIDHPDEINWERWSLNPSIFIEADLGIECDKWIAYLEKPDL